MVCWLRGIIGFIFPVDLMMIFGFSDPNSLGLLSSDDAYQFMNVSSLRTGKRFGRLENDMTAFVTFFYGNDLGVRKSPSRSRADDEEPGDEASNSTWPDTHFRHSSLHVCNFVYSGSDQTVLTPRPRHKGSPIMLFTLISNSTLTISSSQSGSGWRQGCTEVSNMLTLWIGGTS